MFAWFLFVLTFKECLVIYLTCFIIVLYKHLGCINQIGNPHIVAGFKFCL